MRYYDMQGNQITQAEGYALLGDTDARRVEITNLTGGVWVSTVLLVLDHNYTEVGTPIIFETMVFGPDGMMDLDMDRYPTLEDAREGHQRMVTKWTGWTPGDEPPEDREMANPLDALVDILGTNRVEDYRANTTPGSSYALADDVPWTEVDPR